MSYDEIVSDYVRKFRPAARREMHDFESEQNLSAAIRRAGLCELRDGKRHPHQRRIPRRLLEEVGVRLQRVEPRLAKAMDFDDIHRLVAQTIAKLHGIGALTVYDISHRIGAYLGKAPTRVYLHAGTRIGARVFGIKGDCFEQKILPKPFSRLAPAEIEDCLCIYKAELKGIPSKRGYRSSNCAVAGQQRHCSI